MLQWLPRGDHPAPSTAPRIQDMRHTFIFQKVLHWCRQGVTVDTAMPMLPTYVGHANVTNAYWHLTEIPELMEIAAQRLECFATTRGDHC